MGVFQRVLYAWKRHHPPPVGHSRGHAGIRTFVFGVEAELAIKGAKVIPRDDARIDAVLFGPDVEEVLLLAAL